MTRRHWIATAAAAALPPLGAQQPKPNIVLFFADDLGYGDISCYGCPDIRTPHIDGIAGKGVRFVQFYANAPECTPSRTALLTGRYQQRVGGLECAIGVSNVGRYDEAEWLQKRGELGLPPEDAALAPALRQAGYDTALFGKWHLGYEPKFLPTRQGFQRFFGILGGNANYFTHIEQDGAKYLYEDEKPAHRDGYLTDLFAEEALRWLRAGRQRPFFLYMPFTAPHTPIQGPDDRDKKITGENFNQGDRRTYGLMVERMDYQIGRVLDQIERMGAAKNTIAIFLSDNGAMRIGSNAPLRGFKGALWEGGIRVPCAIRWPGVVPEASVSHQVAMNTDLTATLLAAAGARRPSARALDGDDLRPVLTGKQGPYPRTIFFRYKRLENRRKAVRHGDSKYIWDNGEEFLYDLAADPGENHNLLQRFPERTADLRRRVTAWEEEVRAPRLRGFRA